MESLGILWGLGSEALKNEIDDLSEIRRHQRCSPCGEKKVRRSILQSGKPGSINQECAISFPWNPLPSEQRELRFSFSNAKAGHFLITVQGSY